MKKYSDHCYSVTTNTSYFDDWGIQTDVITTRKAKNFYQLLAIITSLGIGTSFSVIDAETGELLAIDSNVELVMLSDDEE